MAIVNNKGKGRPPFYRKGYEKGVEGAVQQQDSYTPHVIEKEAKIFDYLNGEYPQLRNITEAAKATKLDRKTIRHYLGILRDKRLATADVKAKNMYALTPRGKDYIKGHFS